MPIRHYLTGCLCFKNAAHYLAEWMAFYSVLGVERFYLYDNDSTDNFMPHIVPYINKGVAVLTAYPGRGVQKEIYIHCLKHYGHLTRWMMFCDDDEFMFPVRDVTLPEALAPYERYAGVGVNWMMYGSSGHLTRPTGLVIDNYVRRAALPDPHLKCVVWPEKIVEPVLIAHQFRSRGALIVDEKFHPVRGPMSPLPSTDVLRINHYATKSREELIARRTRVQANTGELSPLSIDEWLKLDDDYNEIEDRSAERYVERVRDALLV